MYGILWILVRASAAILFRYRVEGQLPKTGGLLIAANHASYVDIPLLGCGIKRRAWYLGRNDLFPVPVLNGIVRRLGWIPLKPGRLDREAFGKAISLIQAGKVVVIFPEGRRSPDGHLRESKSGIGVIVSQTGCPVVPAYLKGTFDVLPTGGWWLRFRPVTVRLGAPLTFEHGHPKEHDKGDAKRFYQLVSRTVMTQIAALGNVPSPGAGTDGDQVASRRPTTGARNAE